MTEPGRMPVIALDGKTLKGSFDHLNDRKAAQALSAFASEAAILLAHSAWAALRSLRWSKLPFRVPPHQRR